MQHQWVSTGSLRNGFLNSYLLWESTYRRPGPSVGGWEEWAEFELDWFQVLAGIVAMFTYASAGWICYGLPYLYNDDPKYVKVLC